MKSLRKVNSTTLVDRLLITLRDKTSKKSNSKNNHSHPKLNVCFLKNNYLITSQHNVRYNLKQKTSLCFTRKKTKDGYRMTLGNKWTKKSETAKKISYF